MVNFEYKPVAHDATFKRKILAKPGVKKAYVALEEEYATLHAMLDARLAAGLTQADVAKRMGTTVSAVSRLEASLRSENTLPLTPHSKNTRKRAAKNCWCKWSSTIPTISL